MVKKILEDHKRAKTSVIAEEVDKELKAVHEKRAQTKSVDKYKTEIQSTVTRIQKKITDILSSKTWSDNERNKIKAVVRKELKKIFESLK